MKPLLPLTDPRYLRRLARELRALPDGFYSGGIRYSSARFSRGALQGYRPGAFLDPHDPRSVNPWRAIDAAGLSDSYGRTICASRTP